MPKMSLTSKVFSYPRKPLLSSPSSSFFIRRQVWKVCYYGGDTALKRQFGCGISEDRRLLAEEIRMAEQERKDRATETAQEAWQAIEEVASEMKQRVVPNMDANKETDIRDEMLLIQDEEDDSKTTEPESCDHP
ncbi:unnamed protein product [Cuscuta epithymum]|uniref:Uncharacterized protein n=1 Tax=Cuscuta epithymum TaxID=186058 RepID=A0AAV0CQP6_9ASTE|nr:unnamed protein product [Cuscuta epithymum]